MHSKSLSIIINTSENVFFSKPLVVSGVLTVSLGVGYFLSSAILTKISSFTLLKIVTLGSILGNLSFFEQFKELRVFLDDLSTTFIIKNLVDEVVVDQIIEAAVPVIINSVIESTVTDPAIAFIADTGDHFSSFFQQIKFIF